MLEPIGGHVGLHTITSPLIASDTYHTSARAKGESWWWKMHQIAQGHRQSASTPGSQTRPGKQPHLHTRE